MIIQPRFAENVFELKTRDTTIRLGDRVTIGEFVLPGPGEYEVAGVLAEDGSLGTRLAAEDLALFYLRPTGKKLTDKELEALGAVDILFVAFTDTSWTAKEIAALVTQAEAPIVIPMVADGAQLAEFVTSIGRAEQVAGSLKITHAQLPTEGSRIVVFEKGNG